MTGQFPTETVYCRLSEQLLASVAITRKTNEPFADGVPDSTPPPESVRPVGSVPDTVKAYGLAPPLAETIWLYGMPIKPAGSESGDNEIVAQPILIVYASESLQPLTSVVRTRILNEPLDVGVPVSTPPVDIVTPGGNEPEERV